MQFSTITRLACIIALGCTAWSFAQDSDIERPSSSEQASQSQSQESLEDIDASGSQGQRILKDVEPDARRENTRHLGGQGGEGSAQTPGSISGVRLAEPENLVKVDRLGEPLYLPLGGWLNVQVPENSGVALPFTADGPGVLTLLVASGEEWSDFAMGIVDAEQRYVVPRGVGVGSHKGTALATIAEAGEYTIQLTGMSGEIRISAEWLAFKGLFEGEVILETRPSKENLVTLDLTQPSQLNLQADGTLWLSLVAEQSGQAVVQFDANRSQLRADLFLRNDFSNEALAFEQTGHRGRKVLVASFPLMEGQVYFLRVTALGAEVRTVNIRPSFVPDPAIEESE